MLLGTTEDVFTKPQKNPIPFVRLGGDFSQTKIVLAASETGVINPPSILLRISVSEDKEKGVKNKVDLLGIDDFSPVPTDFVFTVLKILA